MGLLEEVRSAQTERTTGPKCWYRKVSEELSAEDLAELHQALDDPSIWGTTIARILRGRGFPVSDTSVQRHRAGTCRCE